MALESELKGWLDAEAPYSWVCAVIGTPHSGTMETITRLASARSWRVIDPPAFEDILSGGREWLEGIMDEGDSPIVIAQLERCYLRHYNGLSLIRRLLDLLLSANRRFLLGCNSWAWAYLNKALDLAPLIPYTLTLRPLDKEHLECWFSSLADERFVFRLADGGDKLVLPVSFNDSETGAQPTGSAGDFLDNLTAYSRGIPGVAWAVWRHSLREARRDEAEKRGADPTGPRQAILVAPWTEMHLPAVPDRMDRSQLFVLQTILLHDSLPPRLIRQLLSLSSTDVLETLHHLRSAGLLDADRLRAMWRVTPEGYPVVRQLLKREGYLVGAI
ncbi:MAG: hypothetical protein ACLGPL_05980 [Acidobacteriota bacterium]